MLFDSNTFGRKKLKTVGLDIFPARRNETVFFIFIVCLQRLNTVTTCSSIISGCFFMYEYKRLFVINVMTANTITPASQTYRASLYKENGGCCSALALTSDSLFFHSFRICFQFHCTIAFYVHSTLSRRHIFGITSDTLER